MASRPFGAGWVASNTPSMNTNQRPTSTQLYPQVPFYNPGGGFQSVPPPCPYPTAAGNFPNHMPTGQTVSHSNHCYQPPFPPNPSSVPLHPAVNTGHRFNEPSHISIQTTHPSRLEVSALVTTKVCFRSLRPTSFNSNLIYIYI